jgi:hypothetical protein
MAYEGNLRVWGGMAPKGSPERDYFEASVRHYPDSEKLRAAGLRLIAEGCPPFRSDEEAQWDGKKWTVVKKAGAPKDPRS